MEIFEGHRALPRPLTAPAVALGNFDGVHRGHQKLLERASTAAARLGGQSVVFTFDPHPARVLAPELAPRLITTRPRKLELFAAAGVDVCILEPFRRELSQMEPDEFVDDILCRGLGVRHLVVGYDFTYGRDRSGDVDTLRAAGERRGFEVEVVPPVTIDGIVASSTKVRNFIAAGNFAGARLLLGRDFEVDGRVVRGAGRGRDLGVPTANLETETELLPGAGIYAVFTERLGRSPGERLPGAASLGTNPTFAGDGSLGLEVHLLDFDDDLYGERLRVSFVERLRDERRFESVGELVAQMRRDIEKAREILRGGGYAPPGKENAG